MVWVPITDVAQHGIVRDRPAHQLPPNAWSAGRNVRFLPGYAQRSLGNSQIYAGQLGNPYWAFSLPATDVPQWLYADLTALYGINDLAHSTVTRTGGAYSTTEDRLWNGGELGGIAVVTNGEDVPQSWVPGAANAADLANWPAMHQCRLIRPFRNFLIALYMIEGTTERPHRVRWSNPAVPGALPTSWALDDPDVEAGEFDISDTISGGIRAAEELRNALFIYKELATYVLQYIGGTSVFRSESVFSGFGAAAEKGVTAFTHQGGEYHCVFTGDDVIVHDGRQVVATLSGVMKKHIARNLSAANYGRSFVVNNPTRDENWICYPTANAEWPDQAIVMNYATRTLGVRDLPADTSWIAPGIVKRPTGNEWNNLVGSWEDQTEAWGDHQPARRVIKLLECNPTDNKFYEGDVGSQLKGEDISGSLTKEGILLIGMNERTGEPISNQNRLRRIDGVRPWLIRGSVDVEVGYTKRVGEPISNWQSAGTFNGGDSFIDLMGLDQDPGRAAGIRFTGTSDWQLEGYELDIKDLGMSDDV